MMGLFGGMFFGIGLFAILAIAFWVWMIIDVAQRKFRNSGEKIVWIVVVVIGGWIGALVYLLVIRISNPNGLMKK